jgi:hypothetical protein
MEDETEVLDWGNEDDEQQQSAEALRGHLQKDATDAPEDTEDAVSLGSRDDDVQEFPATETSDLQHIHKWRPSQLKESQDAHHHESPSKQASPQHQHSSHRRSHSFSKITHALPPKPVVSHVPFVQPFDPSIIEATAMSRRTDSRDKKANGKPTSPGDCSSSEPLPPDWDVRQSRNTSRGVYYYNTKTHVSTWTRPSITKAPSTDREKGRDKDRSQVIQESHGRSTHYDDTGPVRSPEEPTTFSRSAQLDLESPSKELTYDDRHYRPGGDVSAETGMRDERPPQRSFTPPPSPPRNSRQDLSISRDSRTRTRHSSLPRTLSLNHSPSRDTRRDNARVQPQTSPSDRRWGPPPVPLDSSKRRRLPSPELTSPTSATYEDSRKYYIHDGDWSSSSIAHSTLSASSSSHSTSPRAWRICSSRGGGRICLAKPRELSSAIFYPSSPLLGLFRDRLKDAAHGSFCSSPFFNFFHFPQFSLFPFPFPLIFIL